MQYLPAELLSHIGKYANVKTCKALLETSKLFHVTFCEHESHEFVVYQDRVHSFLERLHKTLTYVHKIKPNVKQIKIELKCITDPPIWSAAFAKIPAHFNILLYFTYCRIPVMQELIKWFEPGFRCEVERNNLKEEKEVEFYSELQSLDTVATYMQDQQQTDAVMRHPNVVQAKKICLGHALGIKDNFTLDLSRVQVEENKIIHLSLFNNCDVNLIDAHKITDVYWNLSESFFAFPNAVQSFENDAYVKKGTARLRQVHADSQSHTFTSHHNFLRFVKAVLHCNSVEYFVKVDCPDMIALMYEMLEVGVPKRNIIFSCVFSPERWLIAQYCRFVYPDLDMEIFASDLDITPYNALVDENDYYNALSPRTKQIWSGVYHARQSIQRLCPVK